MAENKTHQFINSFATAVIYANSCYCITTAEYHSFTILLLLSTLPCA